MRTVVGRFVPRLADAENWHERSGDDDLTYPPLISRSARWTYFSPYQAPVYMELYESTLGESLAIAMLNACFLGRTSCIIERVLRGIRTASPTGVHT